MRKKKYDLMTYFDNLKNDSNFVGFNEDLKSDNHVINFNLELKDGSKVNVYCVGLWYIFNDDKFVNEGFVDAYAQGFKKGKEFIENKINNALNGFYKSNTQDYLKELQYAYYNKADNFPWGYRYSAWVVPVLFDVDVIESKGFASGVVSYINLMAKDNPLLFKDFYNCEMNVLKLSKNNNADEKKPSQQTETNKPEEKFKSYDWFKIGLLFATGEMQTLLDKYDYNATKIAGELCNQSYRPYITDSIGTSKTSNKNIFNSSDKMSKIIKHCEENNINIKSSFLDRLPKE